MILGLGCDILTLKHFSKKCGAALVKRVFTPDEIQHAQKLSPTQRVRYYAKRFCAKEAVSKACGCGIGQHLLWQDICVLNDDAGAPIVSLSPSAQKYIRQKFHTRQFRVLLSLSDDEQILAVALIEK